MIVPVVASVKINNVLVHYILKHGLGVGEQKPFRSDDSKQALVIIGDVAGVNGLLIDSNLAYM